MSLNVLVKERASTDFKLEDVRNALIGKEIWEQMNEIFSRCKTDEILRFDPNFFSKSRKEQIEALTSWFARYHKLFNLSNYYSYVWTYYLVPSQMLLSLHNGMFIPCLQHLADDKQKELWLSKALSFKIVNQHFIKKKINTKIIYI